MVASALSNLATNHQESGRWAEAEEAYREARRRKTELARDYPHVPEHARSLASTTLNFARFLGGMGREEESLEASLEVVSLLEDLVRDYPDVPSYRQALAAARLQVGNIRSYQGRLTESRIEFEHALEEYAKACEASPDAPGLKQDLADVHIERGNALRLLGRPREAEEALLTALRILEEIDEERPDVPVTRWTLATTRRAVGDILLDYRPDAAEVQHRRALEIMGELAASPTTRLLYRRELAAVLQSLGIGLCRQERYAEGQEALRESLRIAHDLAERYPHVAGLKKDLAQNYANLGAHYTFLGRFEEAREALQEALELQLAVVSEVGIPWARMKLADIYVQLGECHCHGGSPHAAPEPISRALAIYRELHEGAPGMPHYRQGIARALLALGSAYRRTGMWDRAVEAFQEAIRLGHELVAEFPEVPEHLHNLGTSEASLGAIHRASHDPHGARPLFEQSVAHHRKSLRLRPGYGVFQHALNHACWSLAMVRIALGDHAGGAKALEEAVQALPHLALAYRQLMDFMPGCVDLVRKDPRLSEEDRRAAAERYLHRERELVRAALDQVRDARELDVLAWTLVGWRWYGSTPHEPDVAVKLAERAVSLSPERGRYHGTLGAALCGAERWEEAERSLLTAIRLTEGGNGFDLLCLAIARVRQGERDEARRAYERALEWLRHRPPESELRRFSGENIAARIERLKLRAEKVLRGE
jgi:tetratricopeptide (TPR) repeat protein